MLSQLKNSYNIFIPKLLQMQQNQEVEKVKIICLKDNKNKQEKYMLLQKSLGKGKYGIVYKAVHIDNPDKVFAVKVIKLQSQKIRKQCLQELQIIKHLPKSLNLVQIHSQHLQSNNNFYIFEEYCDGGNLYEQKISRKGKPYTEEQVFNLFFQIVNGFLDLRKANIFHEDIKPQNILIKNNLYKLTDFGISQLSHKLEASQIRRGTLVYMPPQKLRGNQFTPNSKTEIFSLGITLYQVIFGHPPYLKKRPDNYKHYLQMLQDAQLKSAEQLKNYFKSPSLCVDRLIRTILRMIDLSESKRLSLQQLQDYVKNTEPFKSMVVSQIQPIAKRKTQKNVKYEAIAHSKVIVQSQNGLSELLIHKQKQNKSVKQKDKKESIKPQLDIYKICLQLMRDSSGYIQQGILYGKDTKMSQLIKSQNSSPIQLTNTAKIAQIQFMSLLFIERMFIQFQNAINNIIFQSDGKQMQDFNLSIQSDKQFITNQFLKLYMDIESQDKKIARTTVKQKGNQIALIISEELEKIYGHINCVRINFKQDMLAVLWLKDAPKIYRFLKQLLDCIIQLKCDQIAKLIAKPEYDKTKQILTEFSSIQSLKAQKMHQIFDKKIKGHQILEDIESNSDEFEVLDIADLL